MRSTTSRPAVRCVCEQMMPCVPTLSIKYAHRDYVC